MRMASRMGTTLRARENKAPLIAQWHPPKMGCIELGSQFLAQWLREIRVAERIAIPTSAKIRESLLRRN